MTRALPEGVALRAADEHRDAGSALTCGVESVEPDFGGPEKADAAE